MDGTKLQAKVYSGYAKAALRIGLDYKHYRPATAMQPIWDELTTLKASFNAEDMKYGKPNKYGKPTWFGIFDAAQTQVGDYLVGPNGETFFIAAQQALLPVLCVQCNVVLDVHRPAQVSGVGAQGYAGATPAGETLLMKGWPASLLQGTKGEKSDVGLPGDARNAWWAVLMPAFAGVTFKAFDTLQDAGGQRYIISSAELTDMGWRMTAQMAVA